MPVPEWGYLKTPTIWTAPVSLQTIWQMLAASFTARHSVRSLHITERMTQEGIRPLRERLLERLETIATGYLANWPKSSGQVRSVARRFAMIAIGGELATSFGLTGWDTDTAEVLVGMCFGDWLRARGTSGRREDEQAVQQLRDFIARNGSARFADWVDKNPEELPETWDEGKPPPERYRIQNQAGWRRWLKTQDGRWGWCYMLTSSGMREAMAGLNMKDATKVLVDRGVLIPDTQGKTSRPNGHRDKQARFAFMWWPVIFWLYLLAMSEH